MDIAISKNTVPIRLTNERWQHISIGHPEMADFYFDILETIENPSIIYRGNKGELIALSNEHKLLKKFFIVVYKETTKGDGFVITAYLSNKKPYFTKKKIEWKQ